MKSVKIFLLVFLMVAGMAACGGKKAVKPQAPTDVRPVSHQVQEVESTNSAESIFRATGKGSTVEYAIADARKAAIWFLLNAGTKPLLKTAEEKSAMKNIEETLYKDVDIYVRHTSDLKSKRKVGDMTEVEVVVKIDIQMLTDFLVENEVIKANEDVVEGVGLPSISIVASENSEDSDIAKATIGEYLTDKNYEVKVVDQTGKLNDIVGKLAKLSGNVDPAYAWALEAGSDVFVQVKVSTQRGSVSGVDTKKASVTAIAYETATARQLGSTTGHSSERAASGYDALIQEAANAVSDKLISQIRKAWLKESEKGKTFKLVAFSNDAEGSAVDSALYKALKSMTTSPVKRVAAGKSSFQYETRIKDVANSFEFMESLSGKYKGPGKITREMESGTMLVVKAGSGNIEIEIE